MLIFYFSQRGLLAWQKGNKNYSIKQLLPYPDLTAAA